MSSIRDKKVALNLSDGTSVNLNKPTVLDSTVSSFLGLKNGEYCGVCTYSTPEYNSNIFRSSIMDFPFPIFRKGTEPGGGIYDNNFYYAKCPTDVHFYLKVMDFVGDDNRNTQLYAIQLRGANEDPVAGNDVNFPANAWDNGLYIGRSYYSNPSPASLDDETDSESTEHVENNKIAWTLVPDQVAIKDMLPYIEDTTYSLDSNGVSTSDKNSVASARVADYLADGINPRELSNGADLNKCLKVGKYGMDGITVTNGPVAVTIDGTVHYMDAANVGTNTPTTPTMNNAIMTVEMTGYVPMVDNTIKLIQTIVSDDFTVRRVISGLKGTSTLDVINTAASATTFGPWVSLVEDNLTSTSTVAALSAKQGKELKSLIDGLGIKTIDSSITDLAAITESGTYIGTTDFDDKIGTTGSVVYATSFLTNWPRSMIQSEGTPTGVPYVLRVTNVATGSSNNRIYYELLCAALGNQKVYGSSGGDTNNRSITWTNDITCIEDSLTSHLKKCALSANQGRVLNETKQNKPTISTTDLTAGTSSLDTGEFYFVYD